MAFERGFKTRCENIAESVRLDLGLTRIAPLGMETLANYLDVKLIEPTDVPGMSEVSLRTLLEDECGDWSAVTVAGPSSVTVIFNPTNSPGRRSSDLAHEFAHLMLRHAPSTLMFAPDGTWTIRSFNAQQEEEAAWLSGCLLLPRPALFTIGKRGLDLAEAASDYGVSTQLLTYRTNVTGVARQLANGL